MIKIHPQQIQPVPQTYHRTPLQNSVCSQVFAKVIQFIRDLYHRICVKKIENVVVVREPPITIIKTVVKLLPPILAIPLSQDEQTDIDVMDLHEAMQNLETFDTWLEEARQGATGPNHAECRQGLAIANARRLALQARQEKLQRSVIVDEGFLRDVGDMHHLAQVIEKIAHFEGVARERAQALRNMDGDERGQMLLDLDLAYSLLAVYRARRDAIQQRDPAIIPEPLREAAPEHLPAPREELDVFDNWHIDGFNRVFDDIDSQIAAVLEPIHQERMKAPDVRDAAFLAASERDAAILYAQLPFAIAHANRLRAAQVPREILDILPNHDLHSLNQLIETYDDRITVDLSSQVARMQGDELRIARSNLAVSYAILETLKKRRDEINNIPPRAPVLADAIIQGVPLNQDQINEIAFMNIEEVELFIAGFHQQKRENEQVLGIIMLRADRQNRELRNELTAKLRIARPKRAEVGAHKARLLHVQIHPRIREAALAFIPEQLTHEIVNLERRLEDLKVELSMAEGNARDEPLRNIYNTHAFLHFYKQRLRELRPLPQYEQDVIDAMDVNELHQKINTYANDQPIEFFHARLSAYHSRATHLYQVRLTPQVIRTIDELNYLDTTTSILSIYGETYAYENRLRELAGEERRRVQEDLDIKFAWLRDLRMRQKAWSASSNNNEE